MLTPKENFLETLKKTGGKPDRLVNGYEPLVPVMIDPVQKFTRGNRKKGMTTKDRWGTEIAWPEDQLFAMPHITPDNKVCPDVTEWKKQWWYRIWWRTVQIRMTGNLLWRLPQK